jgi:hypothetical protein
MNLNGKKNKKMRRAAKIRYMPLVLERLMMPRCYQDLDP